MTLKQAERLVKAKIREQGLVVAHFRVKDITEAARDLLEQVSAKAKD